MNFLLGLFPRNIKATKKQREKKNTYIVCISQISGVQRYALSKTTPLAVVKKNGKTVQSTTKWMTNTHFPNPGANRMVVEYDILNPLIGNVACTIVEYLDKETGTPVAYLFPTGLFVCDGFENNYEAHMNHASRRDLKYQIAKRQKLLNIAYQKTK